jgi:DNA repair exonuclease SbcCD ATPase subunit
MSATDANAEPNSEQNFDQMLQTLDGNVTKLKERYAQIQTDQARQTELKTRKAEIANQPELAAELEKIEKELSEIDVRLESQLIPSGFLKDYFWQTVRFVGLGMAIGWGMAFYVMKHPTPSAIEPNQPTQLR